MVEAPRLSLAPITALDLPTLVALMTEAFDRDLPANAPQDRYCLDCYHTTDLLEKWPAGCLEAEQYKILADDQIIGAAVIWHFEAQPDVLGLLFIAATAQHHGLGAAVWAMIEAHYPASPGWLVATPAWSPRSLNFYRCRCGFEQVGAQGDYVIMTK
ncbi:MAG: GNAT family N-acetyltransferase [Oscillochloridaceae bacterium umkhey_bin13]